MAKHYTFAIVSLYPPQFWEKKKLKSLFIFYKTRYVVCSFNMDDTEETKETRLSSLKQWYNANAYSLVTDWID